MKLLPILLLGLCLSCQNSDSETPSRIESGAIREDSLNYLRDIATFDHEGRVNVVVEIPAGSNDKWELNKENGQLEWQQLDNQPRIVDYLGYPGNYGMIPRTLVPQAEGGDGDPLDVLVLGPSVERGQLLSTRLIGVLRLKDHGETDDKLLAVSANSPLAGVESLAQLDSLYPGISEIIQLWFVNYKRDLRIESLGYYGPDTAQAILEAARKAYQP